MKIKNEKLYPTEMVLEVIQKEIYLTVGNAAAHFGLKRNAFYTRSDFKQIREHLDCNRATMIDYIDTLLWERIKSGNADVAMFVLFYKRYGDQEVRDSLRCTAVLESSTKNIIPLCDFE